MKVSPSRRSYALAGAHRGAAGYEGLLKRPTTHANPTPALVRDAVRGRSQALDRSLRTPPKRPTRAKEQRRQLAGASWICDHTRPTEGTQNVSNEEKGATVHSPFPIKQAASADPAAQALPLAVPAERRGRTRSLAVSQRGHGHHLFQTQSETDASVARSRADLAGEASCVRSL